MGKEAGGCKAICASWRSQPERRPIRAAPARPPGYPPQAAHPHHHHHTRTHHHHHHSAPRPTHAPTNHAHTDPHAPPVAARRYSPARPFPPPWPRTAVADEQAGLRLGGGRARGAGQAGLGAKSVLVGAAEAGLDAVAAADPEAKVDLAGGSGNGLHLAGVGLGRGRGVEAVAAVPVVGRWVGGGWVGGWGAGAPRKSFGPHNASECHNPL